MSVEEDFDDVDEFLAPTYDSQWLQSYRELVDERPDLFSFDERSSTLADSSPITPHRQQATRQEHTMPRRRREVATPPEVVDLTSGQDESPTITRSTARTPSTSDRTTRKRRHSEVDESEEPGVSQPSPVEHPPSDGKERLGTMSCIICMEPYTNMTMGLCGHVFCHECLIRALQASERQQDRGAGSCPSCRKPIFRKRAHQVIPINLMTKKEFKARAARAAT